MSLTGNYLTSVLVALPAATINKYVNKDQMMHHKTQVLMWLCKTLYYFFKFENNNFHSRE